MSHKKNIIPFILAIVLHLALVGLLVWNFAFDTEESPKQFVDAPVQAKLVTAPETPKRDAASLKRQQKRQQEIEQARKKREEEQKRQQELAHQQELEQQQEAEKQKVAEQEKQRQADAEKQRLELEKKKQQDAEIEKKRLAEEAKQKAEAEAEKKRIAEEERKKKEAERKRIEDEKRKKAEAERKKREEAERKRRELEEQMASLDDELFEADKGDVRQTQIMSEVQKIQAAIQAKIIRNWDIPQYSGVCIVRISMGPGGIVLNTEAVDGDDGYCESAETAINRAAPLPSSDDPQVMAELKSLRMTFDPSQKEN